MSTTVHVENITELGARRRRVMGIVLLVAALVAAVWMITVDAPRWSRLLLVVPFGLAANGFLQARERTCVVLGAVNKREDPKGGYSSLSSNECAAIHRQMRVIILWDVAIAIAATAIVWLI